MIGTQGWMVLQVLMLSVPLYFAEVERENWICRRLKPSYVREDTETRLPLCSLQNVDTFMSLL